MNIFYFAGKKFPNSSANSVQILKTCDSINKTDTKISLIGFESEDFVNNNDIFNKYNINPFEITLLKYKNSYIKNELSLMKYLFNNRNKIRIIHTRGLIFALFAKIILGKKVIYEVHDFVKGTIFKFLFSIGVKRFDHIVVISNKLKKELSKTYKIKNISNLPDGVSLEDFKIKKNKYELRKELNLPKNKFIVTYVGSFKDFKGFFTFLDSVKYLKNTNILLLGIGGNNNQIYELNKNFNKFKSNFKLLSSISHKDVSSYLKSSDSLIIPNSGKEDLSYNHKVAKYYTSPLKLFEYMCARKPIIASNVPAIREILDDESAIFFKPDSPKSIANTILKLKKSSIIMNKLSRNAFNEVEQYSWENRGKGLNQIYINLK